jgi:hypothetical protein
MVLNYSRAMVVLATPLVFWATRATSIIVKDLLCTVACFAAALVVSAGAGFLVGPRIDQFASALLRLILGSAVLYGVYLLVLLFVLRQLQTYFCPLRYVGFLRRWLPTYNESA